VQYPFTDVIMMVRWSSTWVLLHSRELENHIRKERKPTMGRIQVFLQSMFFYELCQICISTVKRHPFWRQPNANISLWCPLPGL